MTKINVKVEIPEGKYCQDPENQVFCQFCVDSTASVAGMCGLITGEDSLLHYEDTTHYKVLKNSKCPLKKLPPKALKLPELSDYVDCNKCPISKKECTRLRLLYKATDTDAGSECPLLLAMHHAMFDNVCINTGYDALVTAEHRYNLHQQIKQNDEEKDNNELQS